VLLNDVVDVVPVLLIKANYPVHVVHVVAVLLNKAYYHFEMVVCK